MFPWSLLPAAILLQLPWAFEWMENSQSWDTGKSEQEERAGKSEQGRGSEGQVDPGATASADARGKSSAAPVAGWSAEGN